MKFGGSGGLAKAPCKECEDRILGCHDRCNKYKAFKEELKDIHEKIHKENEYFDFHKKRVMSCIRYGGR